MKRPRGTQRFDDLDIDEDVLCSALAEAAQEALDDHGRWRFRLTRQTGSSLVRVMPVIIALFIAQQWQVIPDSIALIGVVAILLFMIVLLLHRCPDQRRRIRAALNRRGYRLCLECGYSLEGLGPTIAACPECGSAPPSDTHREATRRP